MLGAIAGDIAGSIYEFDNIKTKDFVLFANRPDRETGIDRTPMPTDDTFMTLAVAEALMDWKGSGSTSPVAKSLVVDKMQAYGARYPHAGYGGRFFKWLSEDAPRPYGSYGNGAAMRVSPCAWLADSLEEALANAYQVTSVSHDHRESLKAAEAVTKAIWMGRHGASKIEIGAMLTTYYDLSRTLDQIRPTYRFNETCQDTVPQALTAFLESHDFEDSLRCAISLGGDSDTLADITGAVAESVYGIPSHVAETCLYRLAPDLRKVVQRFRKMVHACK